MEIKISLALVVLLAYLTGSIPTSVWVGRWFYKIDIREHGSGNAGATNTMRVLGVRIGLPVLLFDIFKGWISASYGLLFSLFPEGSEQLMQISILLGIMAVTGHIYPAFAGFRGGKGVASIFGVLLALAPVQTLCAGGIFIIVLLITKYVSMASITAGISFPVLINLILVSSHSSLRWFSVLVAILLLVTHFKNIRRLLQGKENKASFLFRKKAREDDV